MNDTRVPILLPLPFPGPFDYAVPEGTFVEPGSVVRVPLGPRTALGVVWDEANFAAYVMDPTAWLRDTLGDDRARSRMSYKVRSPEDAVNLYAYLAQFTAE